MCDKENVVAVDAVGGVVGWVQFVFYLPAGFYHYFAKVLRDKGLG